MRVLLGDFMKSELLSAKIWISPSFVFQGATTGIWIKSFCEFEILIHGDKVSALIVKLNRSERVI